MEALSFMVEAKGFADNRPLCHCRLVFDRYFDDDSRGFPFSRKFVGMVA